jgi:hypothetical protein
LQELAAVAASTTAATALAGLSFNGLDGIAATGRGLLCDAQKGSPSWWTAPRPRSSPSRTHW